MKIYVASSWRNERQPKVVEILRLQGHEVYDFKNPAPGNHGFHWSEIDPNWQQWTPAEFSAALDHPIARAGFKADLDALEGCDACVLVLPSGRSAHLEAGFAIGAGKPTAILLAEGEPELMYKMARVFLNVWDIVSWLETCCHYQAEGGFNVPTLPWCTHSAKTDPRYAEASERYEADRYAHTARVNPATGWSHYESGAAPAFDDEQ